MVPPIKAEAASINRFTDHQKLNHQCVQPVQEQDQVHQCHVYRGSGKCRKQCDLFFNWIPWGVAHYFIRYSEVWQSVSDSLAAWSVGGSKYPGTRRSVYGEMPTTTASIFKDIIVRDVGAGYTSKDWYFENATISS